MGAFTIEPLEMVTALTESLVLVQQPANKPPALKILMKHPAYRRSPHRRRRLSGPSADPLHRRLIPPLMACAALNA
jgi:hypothetical protein